MLLGGEGCPLSGIKRARGRVAVVFGRHAMPGVGSGFGRGGLWVWYAGPEARINVVKLLRACGGCLGVRRQ